MKTYRIEIDPSAWEDIEELTDWIRENMSLANGERYIDAMLSEVNTLSIYADIYQCSRFADIQRIHPKARRMISHNKKWVYVFHIEDDAVVVDRIINAKIIKR